MISFNGYFIQYLNDTYQALNYNSLESRITTIYLK